VRATAALDRADAGCDVAVGGFALFTLVANLAVFVGAGLDAMLAAAGACLSIAGLVRWRARRKAPRPEPAGQPAVGRPGRPAWPRVCVAAFAAAVAAGYALGAPLALVWLAGAVLSGVLCAVECIGVESNAERRASPAGAGATAVLAGMSLLCVVAVLVSHRPDTDDAFYLNLAVAAADHPAQPLLAHDTLHGIAGIEMSLPVYRVHSLELLVAGLSRWTGRPALDVAHLWLPALAALLIPLAYARLFRLLIPERWLWAVGIAVAYLLYANGGSHGWPNFGLVRLHQGKSMLLTLMLPLLAAYAIEFGRKPSSGRWWRLAGAQVAALGLSASALWLAPLVAGIAVAAGIPATRAAALRARTLIMGFAASGYVLAVALALRGATEAAIRDSPIPIPEVSFDSAELATQALRASMGAGPMAAFTLFAALSAWSFCDSRAARRYCAFFALAWLLVWNPFTASWIAAHLTGAPTYWRSFWLLPMPVLVAVVLSAPLALGGRARPWLGRAAVLALTSIVFLGTVRSPTLSSANHVRIGWPGWKVPGAAFEAARVVASRGGPGAIVLAPRSVAPWIPTFHDHPYPLVVRTLYLPVLHGHLTERDLRVRIALMRLVSGDARPPHADELLRDEIAERGIRVVCLSSKAADWEDITEVLADSGLRKIYWNTDYQVWVLDAGA
jgi:hypothetical protein